MTRGTRETTGAPVDVRAASGDDGTWCDISDEELTALALAADPSPVIDPTVAPWSGGHGARTSALPDWYMPPAMAVRHGRGTRAVVIAIIAGFVLIDACGLCITSGFLTLA